jgi:hypothetical protein
MMLDLSDTTNYPHTETTDLVLTKCVLDLVATGTQWSALMGVVTDITANTLTIKYFKNTTTNVVTSHSQLDVIFPGSGTDTDDIAAADVSTTAVTTGTDLPSAFGTKNPATGDILMLVDEISGTASARWNAGLFYWTK